MFKRIKFLIKLWGILGLANEDVNVPSPKYANNTRNTISKNNKNTNR